VSGIRGVLFDAGGVLIAPVGGRWNPRYDFERIVAAHHPRVPAELFAAAIVAGDRALNAAHGTLPRDDYHRVMLAVLGIADPSGALLAELDAPLPTPPVEVLPGVVTVLEELRSAGVRLAVVSDAWAGLDTLFAQLGIARYFEGFVISEVLGCRKPDPRMYTAGSQLLDLAPHECLFIDDDPLLVAAAIDLGYHGVALAGAGSIDGWLRAISSLDQLPPIVLG
jgi:putative hydrolase of the HAD superfamily